MLLALAIAAPTAGAIVGGTADHRQLRGAARVHRDHRALRHGSCTGTLISPTVVMTAAHCVYDTTRRGNLLGVSRPSEISVRVGSRNVADPALGVKARVVAVLPQPYYRWDGRRHNHDVALLALDRAMPQTPATLAEQRPDAGKSLLIAGYGATSTNDNTPPAALKVALIDAADPGVLHARLRVVRPVLALLRRGLDRSRGARRHVLLRRLGRAGVRVREHGRQSRRRGRHQLRLGRECECSRSYLVLVSSERGFIDRALATPPPGWGKLRDLPPKAAVKAIHRRLNKRGILTLRVDDDKSRHSRVGITFSRAAASGSRARSATSRRIAG